MRLLAIILVQAVVCAAPVSAQGYPPSQRATMTQNVALTEIAVSYGRPVARGRELFGKLVPWDSVWHPGADSATRISFNHDVTIEGRAVKAGEYSLWLIPRVAGPWTVILNRSAHVFHKPYPGAATDALRLEVSTEVGAHMETLAIYFPLVQRDDAVMRVHWGTTFLALRIKAPFKPN
jgi:hypothetical protein